MCIFVSLLPFFAYLSYNTLFFGVKPLDYPVADVVVMDRNQDVTGRRCIRSASLFSLHLQPDTVVTLSIPLDRSGSIMSESKLCNLLKLIIWD